MSDQAIQLMHGDCLALMPLIPTGSADMTLQEEKTIGEVEPMTLVQGDCLEEMKHLRSGSIDMILTDLPYG